MRSPEAFPIINQQEFQDNPEELSPEDFKSVELKKGEAQYFDANKVNAIRILVGDLDAANQAIESGKRLEEVGGVNEFLLIRVDRDTQTLLAKMQDEVDRKKGFPTGLKRPEERTLINQRTAPFLLISREFDIDKQKGYKSIRPGKTTTFGRSSQLATTERFEGMSNNRTVSRTHFEVLYDGGRISIKDTSTNGTRLDFEKGIELDN